MVVSGFARGFESAFAIGDVLPIVAGCFLGSAVGVIPGMAPTAVLAILLPVAVGLHQVPGLVFLAAVYYGTQYGSSVSAILINVPSEPSSVVLSIDGYELTKRGRGGAAITIAAVASFVGGMLGLAWLGLLAPMIAHAGLAFGPSEFFALGVFGLVALSRLSSRSMGLALLGVGIGMALGTVGLDPILGSPRFTFGITAMQSGIGLVPVAVGLFGVSEVAKRIFRREDGQKDGVKEIQRRALLPTRQEWRSALPATGRGACVGFIFGSIPGPALVLAAFASYKVESFLARGRQGIRRLVPGVAGPKAADDAAVGATLAPLMALGLPFTPVTAVLFAGFVLEGLQPGPSFISGNPVLFWTIVASMVFANVVLLILNVPFINLWVRLLRVPSSVLSSVMIVMMIVGVYALNNSWFDVSIMAASGLLGLALEGIGVERAVVILGLILGPVIELSARQALLRSHGRLSALTHGPITMSILVMTAMFIAVPVVLKVGRMAGRNGSGARS